jgi:hypothetical protein
MADTLTAQQVEGADAEVPFSGPAILANRF